ncbi:Hypothetical protein, putative, partial [Bodo saltans]
MVGTGGFLLFDGAPSDETSEERTVRLQSHHKRTTMTIAEHVSTLLTQWNYYNHLNPQLSDLMKQYLPSRVRSAVEVTVSINTSSTAELPSAFLSTKWQDLANTLQDQAMKDMPSSTRVERIPITELCDSNIMLLFAPWCGYDRHRISEWLLDPNAGQEMAETRVALASHARSILDASSLSASTLSRDDASMISDIRWQPWPTVIAPAALEGDAPGGTIKFRRTGVRYPVLF